MERGRVKDAKRLHAFLSFTPLLILSLSLLTLALFSPFSPLYSFLCFFFCLRWMQQPICLTVFSTYGHSWFPLCESEKMRWPKQKWKNFHFWHKSSLGMSSGGCINIKTQGFTCCQHYCQINQLLEHKFDVFFFNHRQKVKCSLLKCLATIQDICWSWQESFPQ